jgi:hypothetical protein
MIDFNIDEVVSDLKTAVTDILGKDVASWRGFAESQVVALAKQAKLIAVGRASGELTDDDAQFFLDGLQSMAQNFAETLRGLVLITIEKIWNAAVDVLHAAIRKALAPAGIVIPGL